MLLNGFSQLGVELGGLSQAAAVATVASDGKGGTRRNSGDLAAGGDAVSNGRERSPGDAEVTDASAMASLRNRLESESRSIAEQISAARAQPKLRAARKLERESNQLVYVCLARPLRRRHGAPPLTFASTAAPSARGPPSLKPTTTSAMRWTRRLSLFSECTTCRLSCIQQLG